MGEEREVGRRKEAQKTSLLFKGPTVVAALVSFVAAVFALTIGGVIAFAPGDLQGTLLINLSNGGPIPQGLLSLAGAIILVLGVFYAVSAVLLWSEVHWIRGVYLGIVVSTLGMVGSGLGTTFAPGIAATGMIVNVLIVTLLATETWEASRGTK